MNLAPTLTHYTASDVQTHIPMQVAIEVMHSAFSQLASGKAKVPVRTHIHMEEFGSQSLFMPVYLPSSKYFGLKVVGMNEQNIAKGLPMIHALVLVFDADTGKAIASVDATYLTALRTGAVSGLATQLLSRKDSSIAAIIGAGVQARTQLEAICSVRTFEKVWIFNRTTAHAEALVEEMQDKIEGELLIADHRGRLAEADVICAATTSDTPIFKHEELKAGVHINGVGSYLAHMTEVPAETVVASKVIVDQRVAAWVEAGDLIQPLKNGLITKDHIHASLGEIINKHKPGRQSAEEITFFKSVGNAVQDLAVAAQLIDTVDTQPKP